jgi:hypothetical protein
VHEVVLAEDHCPAEILAEDVVGAMALEVLLSQRFGQPGQRFGRVGGMPGDRQRIFVDVSAVDLDPLAHLVDAEQFGQDNGQRVGLLAAGASSAPDPDGV